MRGEILGRVERRRRWSADEKLAVVTASLEPDAVVASLARQFDVTRQQVYDWRRAARRGELGTPGGVVGFLEVVTGSPSASPAAEPEASPVAAVPEALRGMPTPWRRLPRRRRSCWWAAAFCGCRRHCRLPSCGG